MSGYKGRYSREGDKAMKRKVVFMLASIHAVCLLSILMTWSLCY